jgi:hypothetical protein
MNKINTAMFDVLEYDTDVLRPQMVIAAQVGAASRFRGKIDNGDNTSKTFSLIVAPSPAEPSANIDVSQNWTGDAEFTVVEQGYVVVSVGTGAGGQTIKIYNDQELLLDNRALQSDQMVVMRILRPGQHTIVDVTGGALCNVTVQYPAPNAALATDKIQLHVQQVDPTHTEFDIAEVSATVLQPIVIYVQERTHLVTNLIATTDRVQGELVTTRLLRQPSRSSHKGHQDRRNKSRERRRP